MPEKKIKANHLATFRQNISALVRKVTKNNVDYLVIPMIMMMEQCVMNGVLYLGDAVNSSAIEWNGRSIVIYHPKGDLPISANNPDTFIEQNVGTIFNSRVESGKLKADAWLEVSKLESLDDGLELIAKLEANKNIDVSTGMRIAGYKENGQFKGNEYNIVANQITPDHLAILINEKGACSWDDGAGLARNNALKNKELNHNKELPTMDRQAKVDALIKSEVIAENQREAFEKMSDGAFDSFESLAKENTEQGKKITAQENKEKEIADKLEADKLAENKKDETLESLTQENKSQKEQIDGLIEFKENTEKKEKQDTVTAIFANKNNKFTENQLFAMSIGNLENIVSLFPKTDFSAAPGGIHISENQELSDDEKSMQNAGNIKQEKKEGK